MTGVCNACHALMERHFLVVKVPDPAIRSSALERFTVEWIESVGRGIRPCEAHGSPAARLISCAL
jgi:hypothetical protein